MAHSCRVPSPGKRHHHQDDDAASATTTETTQWSQGRIIITVIAVLVGSLLVALGINLAVDEVAHTSTPHLTVGGTTRAGAEFAHATTGSCLQWDTSDEIGTISNLREVNCSEPHRFEVAGVVDLTHYPSQRFSSGTDPLSPEQVEGLRLGLCRPLVDSYLTRGLDPAGRFRVGLLQPGIDSWKHGSRILVCGIEAINSSSPEFEGLVDQQDQSVTWPSGTCVDASEKQRHTGKAVPCSNPHTLEVVGSINLGERFGNDFPATRTQNAYGEKKCLALAETYLGGPSKLRNTTLTVVWTRVSLAGWNSGSRIVTCSLAKAHGDKFAELEGSVKGPFTIEGKRPRKPKPLPPVGNEQLPDMHNDPLLNNSVPGDSF